MDDVIVDSFREKKCSNICVEDFKGKGSSIILKTDVNDFKPKKAGRPRNKTKKLGYGSHHVTFRDDYWAMIKRVSLIIRKNESEVIHYLIQDGVKRLQYKITEKNNNL